MRISIENTTEETLPKIDFAAIKEAVLGDRYDLSVVITPPTEIRKLNLIYRNLDTATDILSFPLAPNAGEIHICLSEARKEAKKFGRNYQNFLAFLFVHGCAHLKGYDHSSKMEKFEEQLRQKFNI